MNPADNHSEEVIPFEERKWNDIPTYQNFKGDSLEAEVSKLVMRLVRHHDHKEKETDGAVLWPKLRKACQKAGGDKFSDSDWLQHIYKGSNKTGFQYC